MAFSSHERFAERVALLDRQVAHWRGWQRARPAVPLAGLAPTQGLWCDFYFNRVWSNGKLIAQLPQLDGFNASFDDWFLFLNEPDLAHYGHGGQCSADPLRSAQLYSHVRGVLPNAKLVAPAVTIYDWQNGYEWLGLWIKAVRRVTGSLPDVAAWDIHIYTDTGDPLAPINDMEKFLRRAGYDDPVFFISEWGTCDVARMRAMRKAYDTDPRIVRHFIYEQFGAVWDGENRCIILAEDVGGVLQLTPLGRAYLLQIVFEYSPREAIAD